MATRVGISENGYLHSPIFWALMVSAPILWALVIYLMCLAVRVLVPGA